MSERWKENVDVCLKSPESSIDPCDEIVSVMGSWSEVCMREIVCVSQSSGENGDMERESVCLCGGSGVDERGNVWICGAVWGSVRSSCENDL